MHACARGHAELKPHVCLAELCLLITLKEFKRVERDPGNLPSPNLDPLACIHAHFQEYKNESIVIEVDLDNQPEREVSEYEEDDEDDDGAKAEGEGEEEDVAPVKFQVRARGGQRGRGEQGIKPVKH